MGIIRSQAANDGTTALFPSTADPLVISEIRAKDVNGLKLTDDSGTLGLTILDSGTAQFTGHVGFGVTPHATYKIDTGTSGYIRGSDILGVYFYNSNRNRGLVCASGHSILKYDSGGIYVYTDKITFNQLTERKTTSGITASTSQTQGQGALTSEINEVATVANLNDTVTLPPAAAGRACSIFNNGANTLQIFPASGDAIDSGAIDASTTLAAGSNVKFEAYDATHWKTV